MVLGRVCFHIQNAGMGGMGWNGKGRDVMGWEWGWGEVHHVEKVVKYSVFYKQIIPRHHCGSLLAFAGQLVAHWGLLFVFLFVTWGGTGALWAQSSKQIPKFTKNGSRKGCLFSLFVG